MRVFAFIFARKGSKGIKNKNIKVFYRKPLIAHTIQLAKSIKFIQDLYVSTDCPKIKRISIKYGIKVIDRPRRLATDISSELLSWKHAINFLEKKKIKFDIFLSLPCTSPLRKRQDIINILKNLRKGTDLSVGITPSKKNPYFNMFVKDNREYLKRIFKKNIIRRQDAPKFFDITTVGYAARVNYVRNCKSIFEGKVKGVYVPEKRAIDIDNIFDFKLAKIIVNKKL